MFLGQMEGIPEGKTNDPAFLLPTFTESAFLSDAHLFSAMAIYNTLTDYLPTV